MSAAMATRPASLLRRDTDHRVIAGVGAGLPRQFGVDPWIVRVAFVAAATAGGVGVAIYALAWVFVPAGSAPGRVARLRTARSTIEITIGIALLALAVLLTFRALGLLFSDAIVWPLTLVAAGAALLWRQTLGGGPSAPAGPGRPPGPAAPPPPVPRAGAGRPARRAGRAAAAPAVAAAGAGRGAHAGRPRGGDVGRRPRRRPRHRGRPRVPQRDGVAQRGARRGAGGARRRGRARRDLHAGRDAARALADRGARRAHPLPGARRDGGAPPRLGAPDARARPAARRRPARRHPPRPPPGARAALMADAPRRRGAAEARARARGRGERGRARPRRRRRRRRGGRRGPRCPRRGARRRRPRGDGERREVRGGLAGRRLRRGGRWRAAGLRPR